MPDTQPPVVVAMEDREAACHFLDALGFPQHKALVAGESWCKDAGGEEALMIFARHRAQGQSSMQARIEELEAALRFIEQHPWGTHDCAQVLDNVQDCARAALSNIAGEGE